VGDPGGVFVRLCKPDKVRATHEDPAASCLPSLAKMPEMGRPAPPNRRHLTRVSGAA
jgi:hypothetical protein